MQLKRYLTSLLLISIVFCGVVPETATYNDSSNALTIVFSDEVYSSDVLLGRISIIHQNDEFTLSGGELSDTNILVNELEIPLVFGAVVDEKDETIFGTAVLSQFWGHSTDQIDLLESFGSSNLFIHFEEGAFIDANSSPSDSATLSLSAIQSDAPTVGSCEYNATQNTLRFVFDRPVQYDQIAEDRSIDGGSGNGLLDPEVPDNDPGEDRNSNGVLDYEVNIIPFNIGFVDGLGNTVSLEGMKSVLQTEDSDTIDIQLTMNDAKRIETGLDLNTLSLNLSEKAFRDMLYNPVASSLITTTVIPDSIPLIADSAAFDYAKNILYIYFRDSENSNFDISASPIPVWGKIRIHSGQNSFYLSTGSVSTSNNSLKIQSLSLPILAQIEDLLNLDENGNDVGEPISCSLEAYAVYDKSENGNNESNNIPISFYAGSSSSSYAMPKPAKDENGRFVEYDAENNLISIDWSTKIGTFNGADVLDDDEIGADDYSDLTGIYFYNTQNQDTLFLNSGRVWRSNGKKTINVELSEPDEIQLESNSNKDSLYLLLDYYTFASTKDNGTPAITIDSLAAVYYVPDTTSASITDIKYDSKTGYFYLTLNEPVIKSGFSTNYLNLLDVSVNNIFSNSNISYEDSASNYTSNFSIALAEDGVQAMSSLSSADKMSLNLTILSEAFTNMGNVKNPPDTVVASYGQYFWITSFEAFPSSTEQVFCALEYVGSHCDILVDGLSADIEDSVLQVIGEAFDEPTVFDAAYSQYDGMTISIADTVRSFTGIEKDTDENGKIIFVFTDIKDEYDLGRNDTQDKLFVHGYSSMNDTLPELEFSNNGDIIYIDVNPLDISSTDNDLNVVLQAMAHEFAKLALQHNKREEEPWILEAVGQMMQKKIFGNVIFFGDDTEPSTSTGNQLTYLSTGVNKLKGRADQHNVYLFFTYLQERLRNLALGPDVEWDFIREICQTSEFGIEATNIALEAIASPKNISDYFADYGMACYLGMMSVDTSYNGIYNFEALDLSGAPSGKSASVLKWDKAGNQPAPYMFKNVAPWSYNWVIMQGYILNIDNEIVYKSPDLNPADMLVFNGQDGIQFKVKKLALQSGYLDDMSSNFEVVDLTIDSLTAYGELPVTTDTMFTFKNLGVDNLGQIDTSSGTQIMMLMVAKVDDAPAPPTSDFWISNITTLPDFSDLFGFQNPGVLNHIDLYVASQRDVYDLIGNNTATISYSTDLETGELSMDVLNSFDGFASYHTSFALSSEAEYSFVFQGRDASGNAFVPDTLAVSTIFYASAGRSILNLGRSNFTLELGALETDQYIAGMVVPTHLVSSLPENLSVVSSVISFGPQDKGVNESVKINILMNSLGDNSKVYQYHNNAWHNIGGTIHGDMISTQSNALGRFVVLDGERHLPENENLTLPMHYALHQNYPNPFNPITTIRYSLPEISDVSIQVFDIMGRKVWSVNQAKMKAGNHSLKWSGKNLNGKPLASGVYILEMRANHFLSHQKMLLIK
jgi:hypothetical protein